jgi:hypothetical protein
LKGANLEGSIMAGGILLFFWPFSNLGVLKSVLNELLTYARDQPASGHAEEWEHEEL